jgi:hypothetical protein
MVLEIGCRGLVLRNLKTPNSADGSLALESGAWEKVAHAALVILNGHTVRLEETVYWGAPTLFQNLCIGWQELVSGQQKK